MSRFRIEILPGDDKMYFAEAFWGDDDAPFVRSEANYETADEAERDIKRILTEAWPSTFPNVIDPTLGV